MKKTIIFFSLFIGLLASCQKEDDSPQTSDDVPLEVKFEALSESDITHNKATLSARVSTAGDFFISGIISTDDFVNTDVVVMTSGPYEENELITGVVDQLTSETTYSWKLNAFDNETFELLGESTVSSFTTTSAPIVPPSLDLWSGIIAGGGNNIIKACYAEYDGITSYIYLVKDGSGSFHSNQIVITGEGNLGYRKVYKSSNLEGMPYGNIVDMEVVDGNIIFGTGDAALLGPVQGHIYKIDANGNLTLLVEGNDQMQEFYLAMKGNELYTKAYYIDVINIASNMFKLDPASGTLTPAVNLPTSTNISVNAYWWGQAGSNLYCEINGELTHVEIPDNRNFIGVTNSGNLDVILLHRSGFDIAWIYTYDLQTKTLTEVLTIEETSDFVGISKAGERVVLTSQDRAYILKEDLSDIETSKSYNEVVNARGFLPTIDKYAYAHFGGGGILGISFE